MFTVAVILLLFEQLYNSNVFKTVTIPQVPAQQTRGNVYFPLSTMELCMRLAQQKTTMAYLGVIPRRIKVTGECVICQHAQVGIISI